MSSHCLSNSSGHNVKIDRSERYLGNEACFQCHKKQAALWKGSHHQLSMNVVNDKIIQGQFDGRKFNALGFESQFYKKDQKYWIKTEGKSGDLEDFEILYSFGIEPLQQYMTSTESGRLQMLPLAWDGIDNQWFHLQEALEPKPGEWIHWASPGLNWNSMCADCHSTEVRKNYNPIDKTYDTTFAEVNVGCEACHGPGKAHVNRMNAGEAHVAFDLDMNGSDSSKTLVDKCGRCHSRRQQLTSHFEHDGKSLLDHYLPEALTGNDLYHSDGQIKEEVFVYGSYLQSKMYHQGISCNDCHNVHSTKILKTGNDLCTTCHESKTYDVVSHHHHTPKNGIRVESSESRTGTGNLCVDCHMPGEIYMGIDFRRDHSLRIPRPDLSVKYQTPNACNDCHSDQSAQWAADKVSQWFGKKRSPHYSETLTLATASPELAFESLVKLLRDLTQPDIARASAAKELSSYIRVPDHLEVIPVLAEATQDLSPLVRVEAILALGALPLDHRVLLLTPLLKDEVRAVRIVSAQVLADADQASFKKADFESYEIAKAEYENYLEVNSDFVFSHDIKAQEYEKQGDHSKASQSYQKALNIDSQDNVIKMKLAYSLYYQKRFRESEKTFREIIKTEPTADQPHYALGLLLAEQGRVADAEHEFEQAGIKGNHAQAWYSLAVIKHQKHQYLEAKKFYKMAIDLEPAQIRYWSGGVSLLIQKKQWEEALKMIDSALVVFPADKQLLEVREFVKKSNLQY